VTRRHAVRRSSVALALGLALASTVAWSHELDSASLTLTEVATGRFVVRWRASSTAFQGALESAAQFPSACRLAAGVLDCGPSGLVGTIAFPWLEGSTTEVMVDIEWQSHARLLRVLTASNPRLTVYGLPARGLGAVAPVAADYTRLGIEHILTGFDHLLFVIALTLLVRGGRALFATITAFTVAHSLSLAATVLGLVSLPAPPVEAAIALSIVLVCAECLRPADSFARRAPWVVAFAFGLLHGLGFASALLSIGLPENHVPAALLFFNVGVELGQLAAIAVVIAVSWLASRGGLRRTWLRPGLVYAMGAVAASWSIERISAVFLFSR
jgi:hydrogenase/urease accessory protein HupE